MIGFVGVEGRSLFDVWGIGDRVFGVEGRSLFDVGKQAIDIYEES